MDKETMPRVDLQKDADKLKFTDLIYMRRAEKENLRRAEKAFKQRRFARYTASFLGLMVIGIYTYTISAIKQETFLDDFNEPETEIVSSSK